METENELAQAIQDLVEKQIRKSAPYFTTGIWLATESADANLSQVLVANNIHRFIPKLDSVTPALNDVVLMLKAPGVPLTIVGVLVGSITLAEV